MWLIIHCNQNWPTIHIPKFIRKKLTRPPPTIRLCYLDRRSETLTHNTSYQSRVTTLMLTINYSSNEIMAVESHDWLVHEEHYSASVEVRSCYVNIVLTSALNVLITFAISWIYGFFADLGVNLWLLNLSCNYLL